MTEKTTINSDNNLSDGHWVDTYVAQDTALLEDGVMVQVAHLTFDRPQTQLEAIKIAIVHSNMFNLKLSELTSKVLEKELNIEDISKVSLEEIFTMLKDVEVRVRNVPTEEEIEHFDKDGALSEMLEKSLGKIGEFDHTADYIDKVLDNLKKLARQKNKEKRLNRTRQLTKKRKKKNGGR